MTGTLHTGFGICGFGLWLFAVSLGASALGGVLGMAGGIFIVPILTIFGGMNIHTAVAASLVSVIGASCGSVAPFLQARLTNIRLAITLETATTLGALTGVFLAGLFPVPFLFFLFAAILLLSAQQMLVHRREPAAATVDSGGWGATLQLNATYPAGGSGEIAYRVERLPLGLALMYGAGLISALLGIGSGVLKIPAMDTALRLPLKVSSATSNFMIGVTAAASAGAYFVRGQIVPSIAGPVALGSMVGAVLGVRVLMRVASDKLRIFFVIVLVILAIQMAFSAFGFNLGAHQR